MFCTVDKQSSVWSIFRNKVAIKVMNGKSMDRMTVFSSKIQRCGIVIVVNCELCECAHGRKMLEVSEHDKS